VHITPKNALIIKNPAALASPANEM